MDNSLHPGSIAAITISAFNLLVLIIVVGYMYRTKAGSAKVYVGDGDEEDGVVKPFSNTDSNDSCLNRVMGKNSPRTRKPLSNDNPRSDLGA